MKKLTLEKLVVAVYFTAAFVALNVLESSLITHILGISFIIAGTYGIVAIDKKKRFIFK